MGRTLKTTQDYAQHPRWQELLVDACRQVEQEIEGEMGAAAARALRRNIDSEDGVTSNMALATFYRTRSFRQKMVFELERARMDYELKMRELQGLPAGSGEELEPQQVDYSIQPSPPSPPSPPSQPIDALLAAAQATQHVPQA